MTRWATPLEFFERSGDCEDYAIAKYVTLRRLGIQPDQLQIVVVWDLVREPSHAVLAVDLGDRIQILDNLTNLVRPESRVAGYVPIYSVNETARWVYVVTLAAPPDDLLRAQTGTHRRCIRTKPTVAERRRLPTP